MEITSIGLQSSPLLNPGVDRAEARPVQVTPPANSGNASRQADVQPQESTRVSLSDEGRSLLAAEQQRVAAAPSEVRQTPAPQQSGVSAPVSGPVQGGSTSATVNVAAASTSLPPVQPSTQGVPSGNGTGSSSAVDTGVSQAQTAQANPVLNRVSQQQAEQAQQLQSVREDNQARNRQDVSPVVAQGGAGTYQGVLSL